MTGRTLVITNDFPPRRGGIQTYVQALVSRLPVDSVVVYASTSTGAQEFDERAGYPVIRHPGPMLLPTPGVARRAAQIAAAHGCNRVWFGAAAPLGLLAPALRRAGIARLVASTHGHETGWARLPVARQMLRRIGANVDVLTHITAFTAAALAGALAGRARLAALAPGVDTDRFSPDVDGTPQREALGLARRPVIVCVSRLVRRKGQDVLIRALPEIRRHAGDAALLLVGGGPDEPRLRRLAALAGVGADVHFTGPVAAADLPGWYAAGDVFAMPCRTRRAGLDVEGLGMVYLEAAATGLPVVAGNSGGAPEAVLDGRTGYVLADPRSAQAVAERIVPLLADPARRAGLGRAGREWVLREWRWETKAAHLQDMLTGAARGVQRR